MSTENNEEVYVRKGFGRGRAIKELQNLYSWIQFYRENNNYWRVSRTERQIETHKKEYSLK